jgi:hypothetical protein
MSVVWQQRSRTLFKNEYKYMERKFVVFVFKVICTHLNIFVESLEKVQKTARDGL